MQEPIQASVYCVIEKDGRVLLTQDKNKTGLKLPGGEVEKQEFLLEAAKRELKEETGFDVEINGFIGIHEYINKNGLHRMRLFLTAEIVSGTETPNMGEVEKILWIKREEIENFDKSYYYLETYYLAIKDYLKGKSFPIDTFKVI